MSKRGNSIIINSYCYFAFIAFILPLRYGSVMSRQNPQFTIFSCTYHEYSFVKCDGPNILLFSFAMLGRISAGNGYYYSSRDLFASQMVKYYFAVFKYEFYFILLHNLTRRQAPWLVFRLQLIKCGAYKRP